MKKHNENYEFEVSTSVKISLKFRVKTILQADLFYVGASFVDLLIMFLKTSISFFFCSVICSQSFPKYEALLRLQNRLASNANKVGKEEPPANVIMCHTDSNSANDANARVNNKRMRRCSRL